MSPETRYKIEELEELTGLSRRLIYDYISRELVPPAMGSGKGAYYLQEHLDRLRLISLLRTMGFRLERIEEAITTWAPDEISRIVEFAEGRDVESLDALNEWLTRPAPSASPPGEELLSLAAAASPLQAFEAPTERAAERPTEEAPTEGTAEAAPAEPMAEDALASLLFEAAAAKEAEPPIEPQASARPRQTSSAEALARVRRMADKLVGSASRAERVGAADTTIRDEARSTALHDIQQLDAEPPDEPTGATWHRVAISPDIELSYRTDIDPVRRRLVIELIARAKELLQP